MELSFTSLENYISMDKLDKIKINYYSLLNQLKESNVPNDESFKKYISIIHKSGIIYVCFIYVNGEKRIIGTCTGLIEYKLLHGCSKICHIEDVVVDKEYRNKNICSKLIKMMIEYAFEKKCYKLILNCDEKLDDFYTKLQFKNEGSYMVYRFEN